MYYCKLDHILIGTNRSKLNRRCVKLFFKIRGHKLLSFALVNMNTNYFMISKLRSQNVIITLSNYVKLNE